MEFWFRRESQAQRQHHHHQQQPCIADAFGDDVVALAVEKGNGFFLGGEDFMVDDLLDLGELETEEEEEEEEEEDGDDERHKETQQGGLGQGGGGGEGGEEEERGKEIVGAEAGEDNKKPDVSFEPEATPSCSPVSELSLPMHDGAELEWVSRIVDDSLSEFPTPPSSSSSKQAAASNCGRCERHPIY
ncbi:uncharacterized protein A4U43_C04F35750 [Asparagus officinalis]|uniref:Uncharacterized protein n=2 Tax=Asparagus officinalis TaxID=4686 RepID=A0A5P1F7V7_ASPOF|nr:uncharacterized protein A4U43_C04F35750 [Asparagus officinalis]